MENFSLSMLETAAIRQFVNPKNVATAFHSELRTGFEDVE